MTFGGKFRTIEITLTSGNDLEFLAILEMSFKFRQKVIVRGMTEIKFIPTGDRERLRRDPRDRESGESARRVDRDRDTYRDRLKPGAPSLAPAENTRTFFGGRRFAAVQPAVRNRKLFS